MYNPFKGLSDLKSMQQKAKQMQEALANEEVTVEHDGVKVTMRGDQQVKEVIVDGVLENRISGAINEAVKKTQELAARKLMEMSNTPDT